MFKKRSYNMNRYDDENKIISDFQESDLTQNILFFDKSQTCEDIFSIYDRESWQDWINTSDKSSLPHDFLHLNIH